MHRVATVANDGICRGNRASSSPLEQGALAEPFKVIEPLRSVAIGGSVLITGSHGGSIVMSPQAVLDSLDGMKRAAIEAMRGRPDQPRPEFDRLA